MNKDAVLLVGRKPLASDWDMCIDVAIRNNRLVSFIELSLINQPTFCCNSNYELLHALYKGAINNLLRKGPAAPWKSFTQTQHGEAQLNVVVKDREEISATILYSQKTPTEIRRQTKKTAIFRATGNCPTEELEGDADCPHFESMQKTEGIDVRAGQVQMGHHRPVRDTR